MFVLAQIDASSSQTSESAHDSIQEITYISNDIVLDFAELSFRYGIIKISAVEVCNDAHSFAISVRVDEPSLH